MLFDPNTVTFVSGGKLRIPRDDYAERFITWGQFRLGDAVIWFFNTHLPHNHNEAASQKTHARIAKMFLDKRKELGAENEPPIVVGDRNSHASNFNRVDGGGFESNLQANGFTWAYTARGNPGHGNIDQILYSTPHWQHNDCKDSGTGGSDHTSITCDLTLKVVEDIDDPAVDEPADDAKEDAAESECCSKCGGAHPFCSPKSGNCYSSKKSDYYESCDGSTTDPARPERTAPQCCTDCAGKLGFFSSESGNCYKSKTKDYYKACPAVDSNVQEGECKVGGDNWCAATVPDANFSLKSCPGLGMRIKAITYNLFWWNLFGQRGGNHGSAGKLVKGAAGDEPFDLAGFQECDDPNWIMGDAGMSSDDYDYVRWGSNTLAFNKNRFEVLESGDGKFAQDYGTYNYKRGAQWARLQEKSTGNKLFVMNHHGPLPVSTGGVCGGEATAYGALNMIDQHSEPGDAVLFMGDFNADGGSQTVKTLKGYMHHIMDDWVDNFFSNCGGDVVKETKNLGKGGSDHNALMVVMEF